MMIWRHSRKLGSQYYQKHGMGYEELFELRHITHDAKFEDPCPERWLKNKTKICVKGFVKKHKKQSEA